MSANGNGRNGSPTARGEVIAAPTDHGGPVATLERQVRAACLHPPSREVAERHLAAMLAESRRIGERGAAERLRSSPGGRWRRGPALALRLAAVTLTAFALTAGLALAGVRPPEPVADVLEEVGIDVPEADIDRDAPAGERSEGPEYEQRIDPAPSGAGRTRDSGSRAGPTGDRADPRSTNGEPGWRRPPAAPSARPSRAGGAQTDSAGATGEPGPSSPAGRPPSPRRSADAGPPPRGPHLEAGDAAGPSAAPAPSPGARVSAPPPQGVGSPPDPAAGAGEPASPRNGAPRPSPRPEAVHGPP